VKDDKMGRGKSASSLCMPMKYQA